MSKNNKTSFLGELLKRRVPQILGLYIAATWMMIEIGDWMVERFSLPADLTSYIFIGMVVFIPSIFYLAYQYGKPGRDPWKKPTALIIPINLMLSLGAMFYLVSPVEATETKTVVDEQGNKQTFEVPKKEFHKSLLNFYWKNETNDESLDWLQYGLPWLLSEDLDRSLFISSYSPLTSTSITREIRETGFKAAIKVPQSMKHQIAKKRFYHFSTSGKFEKVGEDFRLTVTIFDVLTTKKIAEHQVQGRDYLSLVDELTIAIKHSLALPNSLDDQTTDMAVVDHVSESRKAIKLFVQALKKQTFENDYLGSKQLLEQAVEEDFSFALAYGFLARIQQLGGHTKAAQKSLESALKHEYKFTTQEKFIYKADTYGVRGDYESQVKVYDMWIELYPDSIEAHNALANILTIIGKEYEKAVQSLEKIRKLDPFDDSVLRRVAKLHILHGNMDKAAASFEAFIKLNPQEIEVLIELADLYMRTGEFEQAKKTLDKALLLDRSHLAVELKLVELMIKQFQFVEVEEKLDFLLSEAESDADKFNILQKRLGYHTLRGEINKAIDISLQQEAFMSHLPPIIKIFQVRFPRALFLSSVEKSDEGLALIEELRSRLQRPLSDILDIGVLSIAITENDLETADEYIAKLQGYFKQYPNPIFESALETSLGHLASRREDYELAKDYYKRSLDAMLASVVNMQSNDEILQLQVQYAEVLHKVGESEEAVKIIKESLEIFPSLSIAHLYLARIYIDLDELSKAEASLNTLEKIWKNADSNYLEYKKFDKSKVELQNRLQSLSNNSTSENTSSSD